MPQVYTNITFNEFLQKVSPNIILHKRDVVGGESRNDVLTNQILSPLHELCAQKYGVGYRATSGHCNRNVRQLACRNPTVRGYMQLSKTCGIDWICQEINAHNAEGVKVKFCQCVPKINIDQRTDTGTDVKFEARFIASPGTSDFFGETASALNLEWDYVQDTFSSSDYGNSWACSNCPGSGTLKMTHANSPTYAGVFYTGMSFE
jgi:hypothetical protein